MGIMFLEPGLTEYQRSVWRSDIEAGGLTMIAEEDQSQGLGAVSYSGKESAIQSVSIERDGECFHHYASLGGEVDIQEIFVSPGEGMDRWFSTRVSSSRVQERGSVLEEVWLTRL